MYSVLPSFVLGFHGCDQAVAEAVLRGKTPLTASENVYDWLGSGVYFWENNPARAFEYATQLKKHPRRLGAKIVRPAVIGAVIDLGYCLNLLDSKFLKAVRDEYDNLSTAALEAGLELPQNRRVYPGNELLFRDLDCLVINSLHETRHDSGHREFHSVRAAFIEGRPLYPNSGLFSRNHIQICVRHPRSIKGYFRPLSDPTDPS